MSHLVKIHLFRFNPERDTQSRMQVFDVAVHSGMMLRDALLEIKALDETFAFRHSCGEGVCGSDGVNVNGVNCLACTTPLTSLTEPIIIRPLPGCPIIRDLIVDMSKFYEQYRAIRPYLIRTEPLPEHELLQSPSERAQLDGLYECILCGCCTTACPSFWWNPDQFHGPAALLQAWRFLIDSRDQAMNARLDALEGPYRLFRCHSIMNCVEMCPKQLNPTQAIGHIKMLLLNKAI
ncbi:succinate dehydrogenase iron-sulfur subunit [Rhodoferax sp. 4810]|uniref:Succinate dehydrogenase iron-sulfur subunit n=1 Tax=Thiospirillum jenense TaxID=1653858 RepID=A0A839HC03_9GAMM|nr:succinate dehydrogenase iron-sulfur subunit [Thiospirillum jenense]MBB1074541.1 succinate dehydrogenase iron-sulfur subunit [Rhodoferax jenense]MBB1126515.1 succinate dehydrogenase iron-sulfur subunit [Thiospirillum jenense]